MTGSQLQPGPLSNVQESAPSAPHGDGHKPGDEMGRQDENLFTKPLGLHILATTPTHSNTGIFSREGRTERIAGSQGVTSPSSRLTHTEQENGERLHSNYCYLLGSRVPRSLALIL